MAAVNPRLAALSDGDRQVVESWLVEFDQGWDEQRLVRQAQEIPQGSSWRLPALAEMVKIDLERQWQRGRQVSLESYLLEYPELGSPGDVSADLIQAEFEVRRQFGAPAVLEDYLRRFPHQAAELARLIAQGGSALSRRPASGDRNPAAAPLDLPEQFGRYRLIKRLGQGGMGSVYLAEDTQLQRRVALKVANPEAREDPEARRRLLSEARAAATLDHPYLCPVYDAGEIDGRLYLTMAYIDGQSLAEMSGGNRLPPRQVAALVGKLALALQEAHTKGVVHRDLKPSNVMIKATGPRREPVIVDFGLAHRDNPNEARITRTGQVMGTLAYMAPEQLRAELKGIGPACDIHALGVILYELLTGRLPFTGWGPAVIGQILTQEPLPPSTFRPDLDPQLESICLKAMAKTVVNRYASMAELAAALTDFLRPPAATATLTSTTTTTPSPSLAAPPTPPAGTDMLVDRLLERVAEEPASEKSKSTPWLWPSVAIGVLMLGLLAAGMGGVIKFKTPDGVIVLENVPKDSEILIDGDKITFAWPGVEKPLEIRAVPGKHKVEVKKDGFSTFAKEATFKTEGSEEVTVRLDPLEPSVPPAALLSGTWRVEGEELVQSGGQGTILLGDTPLSSFDLKFQGQIVSGNEGFVALFHRTSDDTVRFFHVGELGGKRVDLGFVHEGKEGGKSKPISTLKNHWYTVLVKVRGAESWCYLDGQELLHDVDDRFTTGRIGLSTWDANARYRDILITAPEGKVLWKGLPNLPK
jgi:serine/threonine protein kinase